MFLFVHIGDLGVLQGLEILEIIVVDILLDIVTKSMPARGIVKHKGRRFLIFGLGYGH